MFHTAATYTKIVSPETMFDLAAYNQDRYQSRLTKYLESYFWTDLSSEWVAFVASNSHVGSMATLKTLHVEQWRLLQGPLYHLVMEYCRKTHPLLARIRD